MKLLSDKELAKFLSEHPLYSKIQFCDTIENSEEAEINVSSFFEYKAYKFHCPYDKDYHTFKINRKHEQQYLLKARNLPEFYLDKNTKINFSIYLNSTCQMCEFKMDLLLNIFSESAIISNEKFPTLYLRKVGQLPAVERNPENEVLNYLTPEDQDNYKKALSNLSMSYDIGAYAYLRRITENEIKRLVKDISELQYENVDKVKKAWNEYEINHQMSNLIDSINPFLPKSLKEIGDNPIKTLYQQTSGGLHEYSETVCLGKARDVDRLLRYVIKTVSSLKHEYLEVREAMANLNSNNNF